MESRSFLPSKRIVSLLFACVFTVVIIFAATQSQTILAYVAQFKGSNYPGPKDSYTAPTASLNTVSDVLQAAAGTDQDNDGLKDWEESLWKTNPTQADTDNDGTSDGAEVAANRDPLKPQKKNTAGTITQNDTISTKITLNKATEPAIPEENLTQTDKFARELFAKYLEAKKSGSVDQNQLIQELVNGQSENTATKQYKETDFVVIPAAQSTGAALRQYGNALGSILASHPAQSTANEFELTAQAIRENSPEKLAGLDPIIAGYQKTLADFARVSVPRPMVAAHLELLNSVNVVLDDIKNFKKILSDPIVGLIGLNRYPTDVERLQAAFKNMRTAFEEQGIVFEQGEYGYIVVHAI